MEIEYYWEIRNIKKEHSLHMQATPDDGLWRVRKGSGQF